MADRQPLDEFKRGVFTFTVYPDGEVHRVEARKGSAPAVLVCHINRYSDPRWSSNWVLDSWKPWISQQARQITTEAERTKDDRAQVVRDNQNPLRRRGPRRDHRASTARKVIADPL